jgi:hypothetical protein
MNRLQAVQNLPLHKPESPKKLEKTAKITAAPVGLLVLTPSSTEAARTTLALVAPVLCLLLLNRAALEHLEMTVMLVLVGLDALTHRGQSVVACGNLAPVVMELQVVTELAAVVVERLAALRH